MIVFHLITFVFLVFLFLAGFGNDWAIAQLQVIISQPHGFFGYVLHLLVPFSLFMSLVQVINKTNPTAKAIDKTTKPALTEEEKKQALTAAVPGESIPVTATTPAEKIIVETKPPEIQPITHLNETPFTRRIDNQMAAIGITPASYPELWNMKEMNSLAGLIPEDERILDIVHGQYGGEYLILVATSERLIFLSEDGIGDEAATIYKLDWVMNLQYTKGAAGLAEMNVSTSSNSITITEVNLKRATNFCDKMNVILHQNETGVADQLAKLADLLGRGLLTEAEFQLQKKKLLA